MRRSYHDYDTRLIATARKLRRESTFPERLLWSRLRGCKLGVHFLRQHPIDTYVVDFYCPEARLAIEIDGRSHDGRFQYDTDRQIELERQGVRFLRFSNDEVLRDLDSVLARLRAWLEENVSSGGSGPPEI